MQRWTLSGDGPESISRALSVETGCVVRGVARLPDGSPAHRYEVRDFAGTLEFGRPFGASADVAADGSFRLRGAARGHASLRFHRRCDDDVPERLTVSGSRLDLELETAGLDDVDVGVVEVRRGHDLTGRAVFADGAPAPGAMLHTLGGGMGVRADHDGRFAFEDLDSEPCIVNAAAHHPTLGPLRCDGVSAVPGGGELEIVLSGDRNLVLAFHRVERPAEPVAVSEFSFYFEGGGFRLVGQGGERDRHLVSVRSYRLEEVEIRVPGHRPVRMNLVEVSRDAPTLLRVGLEPV